MDSGGIISVFQILKDNNKIQDFKLEDKTLIITPLDSMEEIKINIEFKPEGVLNFPEPLLTVFPNKFKVFNTKEIPKEDGIYYWNPNISNDLLPIIEKWINEIYKKIYLPIFGMTTGESIDSLSDQFNCSTHSLNSISNPPREEMDYIYDQGINPIKSYISSGKVNLMLWGQRVKSSKFENLTVNQVAVLMSVYDVLINQGEQRFWDYLTCLKQRRFLYKGDQHPSQANLAYLKFIYYTPDWYIVDLDNLTSLEQDVKYFRSIVLK